MDWFLYDIGLCRERVKRHLSPVPPSLPSSIKQSNLNTHQETKNVHMARNIGQEKISRTQILKFLHQTMNT